MAEHRWNGLPVPDSILCHFCQRVPRTGERFGRGDKDWDARCLICPECWPKDPEEIRSREDDGEAFCSLCKSKIDWNDFCACGYGGDDDGETEGKE